MEKTYRKSLNTKLIVVSGLLIAIGIMIPMIFKGPPFQFFIPGFFSATLGAHVPVIIAMFINPLVGAVVAVGSAMGFLIAGLPLEVVCRALTHIIFAAVGSYLLTKKTNIFLVLVITMILHALSETVVMYFFGIKLTGLQDVLPSATMFGATILVFVLTCAHHVVDFFIAWGLYKTLFKTKALTNNDVAFKSK